MELNIPLTEKESFFLIENCYMQSIYNQEYIRRVLQKQYKYMKLHYFKFEDDLNYRCNVFLSDGKHTVSISLDTTKNIQLKRL